MAKRVGRLAKVQLGTTQIAEMGVWSYTGEVRELLDGTAFEDSYRDYELGMLEPGEITFSGWYDDTDTAGQQGLRDAVRDATVYASGVTCLRLYINATQYLSVSEGGSIIFTKANAISFDKAGIGTIEFTAKVIAGILELFTE